MYQLFTHKHRMTLVCRKEGSKNVKKEAKEKLEYLEKQSIQMKGSYIKGSLNFSNLCVYPDFENTTKFKCPIFKNILWTIYAFIVWLWLSSQMTLVLDIYDTLTALVLTWYTQLDLSKIKTWDDLLQLL